jgi:hypothetical protein
MSAPGTRILFALGARLHMSAAEVERLSARELVAWVDYFEASAGEPAAEPGTLDPRTTPRDVMRQGFDHD